MLTGSRGILSRLLLTVSPLVHQRIGPHAAVSGVGEPRERQAFRRVCPLGTLGVLATQRGKGDIPGTFLIAIWGMDNVT
jgi:hypothetical protein